MPEKLIFEALTLNIEALIFSSEASIGKDEILQVVQQAFEQEVEESDIERSISTIK